MDFAAKIAKSMVQNLNYDIHVLAIYLRSGANVCSLPETLMHRAV